MSNEYGKLLKDPRWQKKRLEILERDRWMCICCEDKEKTLHVHHKYYRWNKKPWEYDDSAYQTLCESCHEDATAGTKWVKEALENLPSHTDLAQIAGYIEALTAIHNETRISVQHPAHGIGVSDAIGLHQEELEAMSDDKFTVDASPAADIGYDRKNVTRAVFRKIRSHSR